MPNRIRYTSQMIEAPDIEPVTLEDARAHLRIDDDLTKDDDYIEQLITTARRRAENQTRRALITQRWSIYLSAFPSGISWRLPIAPVQSIAAVRYYDADNAEQTMPADRYALDQSTLMPRLRIVSPHAWPIAYVREDAVEIELVAGYGDDPEDVPQEIRHWILCAVAQMYEYRSLSDAKEPAALGFLDALLDPYLIPEA
jgi:uncharacterized phiE125 gp8 family phage protein